MEEFKEDVNEKNQKTTTKKIIKIILIICLIPIIIVALLFLLRIGMMMFYTSNNGYQQSMYSSADSSNNSQGATAVGTVQLSNSSEYKNSLSKKKIKQQLGYLKYEIPASFIEADKTETRALYSNSVNFTTLEVEEYDVENYKTINEFFDEMVAASEGEKMSNVTAEEINGVTWGKLKIEGKYRKYHFYAGHYNGKIYLVELIENDIDKDGVDEMLEGIKNSFTF